MSDSNGPGFETSESMRTKESNPLESNRLVIEAVLSKKVNIKPIPNKVKGPNPDKPEKCLKCLKCAKMPKIMVSLCSVFIINV